MAIITSLTALSLLAGCSSNQPPEDFYRVASVKTSPSTGINTIRLEGLKQTSRGLGAQAGLAWRSQQLNRVIENQKHKLDKIYNFNYLMLNNNVLPPVLDEGRNTLNLDNDQTIRISDRDYQIVYPPRFVTAPPNWRDYIWMNYKKPEIPNNTLLPKNRKEAEVWNRYVKIGWNEGVEQADEIFETNVNRLTRDYVGMILYRKLLSQNMVSAPFVSQADLGVTGGGNSMRINDRVLRITSTSELKANSKVWHPVLAKEKNKAGNNLSPELAGYGNTKEKI